MFECLTAINEEKMKIVEERISQHFQLYTNFSMNSPIRLYVRFVFVHDGMNGIISSDKRRRVVNALAKAFSSRFVFNHIDLNDQGLYCPDYFRLLKDSEEERYIKAKTQRDPNVYLHIYSADTFDGAKYRNWSSFPWGLEDDPVMDGVVVDYRNIENEESYHWIIHEVGHWFGLVHTFENGCNPPGDYVDDTEAHSDEIRGCPPEGIHNACPEEKRAPINNYMNYTDCKDTFTLGQIERIFRVAKVYRPKLLEPEVCIPPCPPPM
ncbi:M43 family zinc metalloprotease [Thermaerobacillus caldiproteolyticus]|nr:M43 family zinc metalloprotease [Anoxybacillus caldiproteolyticus]